ncbi:hypothetical protein ACHAXT_012743 [Thalassiosira profunda]
MANASVLFLSHGGGPLPLLDDPGHEEMCATLADIASHLPKPDAILLISAHWEEALPALTSSPHPPLIYDYYGFPEESYAIEYPAEGCPKLARQLQAHLTEAGVEARCDEKRGFDHGLFVPLKIMFPEADVPCVQLSLATSLDPKVHLEMGRALRSFLYEGDNLLIVGSGFSFHNMKAFFDKSDGSTMQRNVEFDDWLQTTMASGDVSEESRERALLEWERAPQARFCHPREEHLLPLHVCYGAAGRAVDEAFSLTILEKKASMFLWKAREEVDAKR